MGMGGGSGYARGGIGGAYQEASQAEEDAYAEPATTSPLENAVKQEPVQIHLSEEDNRCNKLALYYAEKEKERKRRKPSKFEQECNTHFPRFLTRLILEPGYITRGLISIPKSDFESVHARKFVAVGMALSMEAFRLAVYLEAGYYTLHNFLN